MSSNAFKVTELGGKRMNPLAGATNFWKLTTDLCDCTGDATCIDFANVAVGTPKTIASIVVDGVTVPVTPTSTADVADLKEALETAINTYENAPYFELVTNDTNLLIKHYGATVVSAINWASGGPTTLTRSCVLAKMCTFSGQDVGAMTPLSIVKTNGTTDSLVIAGSPFNHTGTLITDDARAVALQLALYNALSAAGYVGPDGAAGANAITVVNNVTATKFDIVLKRLKGVSAVTITGTAFTRVDCADDFTIS